MVQVMNKTTKAVFKMDTMTATEILQKYHNIVLVSATEEEKQELDKNSKNPDELAILGGKTSKTDESGKGSKK